MDSNFYFVAIVFAAIFIGLDIRYFIFRKNKPVSDSKSDLRSNLSTAYREWVSALISKISRMLPNKIISLESNRSINTPQFDGPTDETKKLVPENGSTKEVNISADAENPLYTIQHHISQEPGRNVSNEVVHVQFSADIPKGTIVHITVNVESGETNTTVQQTKTWQKVNQSSKHPEKINSTTIPKWTLPDIRQPFDRILLSLNGKFNSPEKIFLTAALIIYTLVIVIGIDRYPIYFFTDEAAHMNLAANFIRDGFKNYFGEFLPTFFTTEGWVNGTSVYVQVIPYLIFGKSVIVTRLVSAFFSLLGALCVSLLLKDALKLKNYWAGIFLVLTTPAWFLHARTTFEYVEVASFYSIFLYFYSRYRAGHQKSMYFAIFAGALSFYTHGLGQILMSVSGILLFIVDFRYHTHPNQRKTVQNAVILGLILLLPFFRYYLAHPGEAAAQVKRRASYWSDDNFSFSQKILEFIKAYSYGLNPQYWFFKNSVDLNRHTMKDYGNGLFITLPFWAIGLFQTIKNIRIPSYRIILISLLVCPIPASVVAIGMPRMLWVTIPAALLTTIGIVTVLEWVEFRWHLRPTFISIGLFIVLAGMSVFMLSDALINGPIWYEDYSLYGMQYGAQQVFRDVVVKGLTQDPNRQYIVSPSWANGTEQFVDFFIPAELQPRVRMGQPVDFISEIKQDKPNLYFVSTSDEYDKLLVNSEFNNLKFKEVLNFPNNKPGFYVLTVQAANNIEEILATQHKKNILPVEDTIPMNGGSFKILHSPLGSRRMEDVFDNNPDSLARVLEANPFFFDIYPSAPIDTHSVSIQTGSLTTFTITIKLYAPGASEPINYSETFTNLPPDPKVEMSFENGPPKSDRITLEIHDDTSGETSQVHVRSIDFK